MCNAHVGTYTQRQIIAITKFLNEGYVYMLSSYYYTLYLLYTALRYDKVIYICARHRAFSTGV